MSKQPPIPLFVLTDLILMKVSICFIFEWVCVVAFFFFQTGSTSPLPVNTVMKGGQVYCASLVLDPSS